MTRRPLFSLLFLLTCSAIIGSYVEAQAPGADDPEGAEEKVMKAAVAKIAPSVVQIETSGGSDVVGAEIRKGTGPTTGLVVGSNGLIISSAFNFANKPAAIFVAVPGHKERYVAKLVANDKSRMITLLKIEAKGLPVPAAAPKKEIRVGQWSLALGRTWASLDTSPSVSIGIVSAVGRIWGKAIQTDAKVSPVNYGGPLIDLQGRVMGVLVPASPRGEDETAGVEWYDSGIGFAIPLEDIYAVLPRLSQGQDLKKGLLGISLPANDYLAKAPAISSVSPDSAAARAGIKTGDVVSEINGVRIERQAQIWHVLGDKYEGDVVSVKVLRDKKELSFANLQLTGALSAFDHPFLGILSLRDDPELGEEIRWVFPNSPAETAGLKAGDRIMKISIGNSPLLAFSGRDALTSLLNHLTPGLEVKLEVTRKANKKSETVKVILGLMSEAVPDQLPEIASLKKALEPRKVAPGRMPNFALPGGPQPPQPEPPRPQPPRPVPRGQRQVQPPTGKKEEAKRPQQAKRPTGLIKRSTAARDHEYWLFVPEDYDPNIAHALVVWLHPEGKDKDKDTEKVIAAWEDFCSEYHIILLSPKAESETGWLASEVDFVQTTIQEVMNEYTIDRQRVVAHGMGIGGQMAFYMGFYVRDLVRAVATTGAALNNQAKDNVANQRLAFFIVAGGKDPALQAIVESKSKLTQHRFPVVYHEIPEMGHQYLDGVTLRELMRWIDSLDRQ
jgi:S1-C subfamily serine protease/poly(3-hydroxybutyrate) depolymerase